MRYKQQVTRRIVTVEVDEPSTMTLTDPPQSSSIANSDNNHNQIVENPETLREKGPPKTTAPNSADTFTNGLTLLIQHQLGSSEDDDSDDDDESSLRIDEDFEPIQKASSLPNGLIKEEDLAATPAPEYFIKCPQCQKGCQTFQALKEHMEAAHQDLSMTSSDRGSDASLSRLGAASPTPPPSSAGGQGGQFGCSQCAASFPCKDQLEKHELLHSPHAQVCCKVCNKTFANVYRLQRHMISHDESAILRKFKCTECEKAFKFKHHLKEHIRIHSGEKPFECTNCGKRFSHSGSFSSHMTSKKCLVMNLKLGRTRSTISNNLLDKSTHQQTPRAPKRPNISPINNNITTSPNHNSYLPILPKYSEAAAAFLQSSLNGNPTLPPFYLAPPSLLNATHPISPYSIPSLSHILEHLQQQSPLRPPLMESPPGERHREANSFVKSEDNDQAPSNSSECGDLVMDEDVEQDNEDKNDTSSHTSTGDLEAVKRILETVNATVTKELLQANMQKVNSENSSECHSIASAHSPKQTFSCTACRKTFDSSLSLEDHECEDLRSEGLAAKLEDALTAKSDDAQIGSVSDDDQDYERMHFSTNDEIDSESFATTDHMSEDGRKVRVRSLISDEQLKVLKDNYKLNPRPKREELEKIATAIGFPVRVVQVWFQNTRARDRREGKLIQVPYSPVSLSSYPAPARIHPRSVSPNHNEQPLDLSIKREVASNESSPVGSPCRPASEGHSMETTDEVVNLSRKASRSPTPYHPYHSQYHNSNSSEPRQSPSPMDLNSSRLAQILVQPPHKLSLPGMGLVPMDQLMQFGAKDLPSLSHFFSNRMSSLSPNAEKRTWSDRDAASEMTEEDLSKRAKMSQFVLKSLSSPVLGQDSEVEGQFICDQCDKAFSKQSSLARHKYEHSGQRPHKCNECPKAFKHKHHLTEHKRLHTGEKPFECKKCLKRFSHSGSFSQHMNHRYSYCKPYRQ